MLVQVAVVKQRLEVARLVVLDEIVRVSDDEKTLFPGVARLDVLDVVLSIEHEGGLLVAGDLEVLIGQRIEDCHHIHLDQELGQHQREEDKEGDSDEDVDVVDVCDLGECAVVLILQEDVLGGEEDHLVLLLAHGKEQLHVDLVQPVLVDLSRSLIKGFIVLHLHL